MVRSSTLVKKLRMSLGFTQARLAAVLDVDAVTVSRWERGVAYPRRRHLALMEQLRSEPGLAEDRISEHPSIDELVRFVGVEPARRALRKMALLRRKATPVRFLIDPTTRLREVDAALREQTELIEHAKIG